MHNIPENQKNEQQLEAVKNAFARWRKSRRNVKELIPKKLMNQAAKLCSIYKIGRIAPELHLEYNNLKRYCQEYNLECKTSIQQTSFVEMNLGQTGKADELRNCRIILDTGDGRKISINLENPTDQIIMEALKAII